MIAGLDRPLTQSEKIDVAISANSLAQLNAELIAVHQYVDTVLKQKEGRC